MTGPVVAVAGATGAVGVELLKCLETRKFPLSKLKLLASKRSAGRTMTFKGQEIPVEELTGLDYAAANRTAGVLVALSFALLALTYRAQREGAFRWPTT